MIEGMNWLYQTIEVPLIGFLLALILPVGWLARVAKAKLQERVESESQ